MSTKLIENTKKDLRAILGKHYDHETPKKPMTTEFATRYRRFLTTLFKNDNIKVHKFLGNWGDASGFLISPEGKFVYISISFGEGYFGNGYIDDILIRTAEHDRDFKGGRNNRATMDNLKEKVLKLMESQTEGGNSNV